MLRVEIPWRLYQGQSFVSRFDANSYLYITRAMDYYDAADRGEGDLDRACENARSRFLLISFSSDWLYTPEQMKVDLCPIQD
jgi:homoserine O-acetyltransferase